MAFKLYEDDLYNKIHSSTVWKLKKDIHCQNGFYESGTKFISDELIIESFNQETYDCVLKKSDSSYGSEIHINANKFDEYFEIDDLMNVLYKEKDDIKKEHISKKSSYELSQAICCILACIWVFVAYYLLYKIKLNVWLCFLPIIIPSVPLIISAIKIKKINIKYNEKELSIKKRIEELMK